MTVFQSLRHSVLLRSGLHSILCHVKIISEFCLGNVFSIQVYLLVAGRDRRCLESHTPGVSMFSSCPVIAGLVTLRNLVH